MWTSKDKSWFLALVPDAWHLAALLAFCLMLLAACLLPPARSVWAAMGLYQVQEVKPKLFAWVPDDVIDQDGDPQFSRAATAGFILTSEGVVVVDTANSPFHGRELLYEIRERSQLPVKYVINTSSAADHMLGNEVFTDQEATLVSTEAAQAGMRQYRQELRARLKSEEGWKLETRLRGFHVTPTTQTFRGQLNLHVGESEIRILSLPRDASAAQEAAVYLPSAKVLFLGEFYSNRYFPRVGSRDIHRWIEVLRQVEAWDVDTYVPGHGAPGTKNDLVDFRKFLEWLVAQVEMRLKKGESGADVQKELALPKIYNWHAPELATETVEDVCRQLAPAVSPQPTPSATDD